MLRDIFAFNAKAEAAALDDTMTIGELVEKLRLGDWFERYYLMPICGAIWSTPTQGIRDFPAQSLVRFFRNHALLSATQPHQWWTVEGGSIEYVRRLQSHLGLLGCKLRMGSPVDGVERDGQAIKVCADGVSEPYDEVIMACHSDQALRLLTQPTPQERRILSNIRYQDNRVILHRDVTQMPRRRACWSSWVYKADTRWPETRIGVTYWMNRLQNIPETDPLFVTLNPPVEIANSLIYDDTVFRHPVFDRLALKAQADLRTIQGQNNTWFAGAYTRHGFHEDGFASAVRVAKQLDLQFA
jgi:predicted NAD/FAD-binding protein